MQTQRHTDRQTVRQTGCESFPELPVSSRWKQREIITVNNWPPRPSGADISYIASSKLTYLQSSEVHLSTFYTCWHFSCVCRWVRSAGKGLCKVNKEPCPTPTLIDLKLKMLTSFSYRGVLSVFSFNFGWINFAAASNVSLSGWLRRA